MQNPKISVVPIRTVFYRGVTVASDRSVGAEIVPWVVDGRILMGKGKFLCGSWGKTVGRFHCYVTSYLVLYGLALIFGRLSFHDCQSLFLGKQIGKCAHVDARQSYFCWRHLFSMLRVVQNSSGRLFRHNDSVWKNISI